jgi:hypothetical protein
MKIDDGIITNYEDFIREMKSRKNGKHVSDAMVSLQIISGYSGISVPTLKRLGREGEIDIYKFGKTPAMRLSEFIQYLKRTITGSFMGPSKKAINWRALEERILARTGQETEAGRAGMEE